MKKKKKLIYQIHYHQEVLKKKVTEVKKNPNIHLHQRQAVIHFLDFHVDLEDYQC